MDFQLDLSCLSNLPSKYQRGKIYKIVCDICDEIYVGSTTEPTLAKRLGNHRTDSRQEEKKSKPLFQHVASHGGWANFRIVLVENFPCNSKDELCQREEFWRRELNAKLNAIKAYQTEEDRKEYMKMKNFQYRQDHELELKEYGLQYRREHADELNQKMRAYYQEHKEQFREYYEKNADKIRGYGKQYSQGYRNEAKNEKKYYCETCDLACESQSHLTRHNQSKTHIKKREMIEMFKNPPILQI